MFDNMFNTVMDIKGKTKDNLNAQRVLKSICSRLELEMDGHSSNTMPKSAYTLTRDKKRRIFDWMRCLRLEDV